MHSWAGGPWLGAELGRMQKHPSLRELFLLRLGSEHGEGCRQLPAAGRQG